MAPKLPLVTLKKRRDFLATAVTGKRWVSPGFVLQIGEKIQAESKLSADNLNQGFTATTKIGNAVVRNRAKRRLRALARDVMCGNADPSRAYVLVARNETGRLPYDTLRADLVKGLKRLKLWRE